VIYSDGSVDSVSIVDKWNSFDDAFHRRIMKEFKKVNFGKKSRKSRYDGVSPWHFRNFHMLVA
jgi:hypothetical protein